MRKVILSGFVIALLGFMLLGCGGGGTTSPDEDPNAPVAKLYPATLQIPFDYHVKENFINGSDAGRVEPECFCSSWR